MKNLNLCMFCELDKETQELVLSDPRIHSEFVNDIIMFIHNVWQKRVSDVLDFFPGVDGEFIILEDCNVSADMLNVRLGMKRYNPHRDGYHYFVYRFCTRRELNKYIIPNCADHKLHVNKDIFYIKRLEEFFKKEDIMNLRYVQLMARIFIDTLVTHTMIWIINFINDDEYRYNYMSGKSPLNDEFIPIEDILKQYRFSEDGIEIFKPVDTSK